MRTRCHAPWSRGASALLILFLLFAFFPGRESTFPSASPPMLGTSRSTPSLLLSEGLAVSPSLSGSSHLIEALTSPEARPTTLATGDFDADGWADVAAGFRTAAGGAIALYLTDEDIAGNSGRTWDHRRSPFRPGVSIIATPASVDFLAAGDFDADGRLDLVSASNGMSSLHHYAGDGMGHLAPSSVMELPGAITAMTVTDANLRDGLEDLVVGTITEEGARLLVFEGPRGAIHADPESFEFSERIASVVAGHLDDHWAVDLAVAAGKELVIIRGRYKEEFLDPEHRIEIQTAAIRRRNVPYPLLSIRPGNFLGSGRTDLALAFTNGSIAVFDVETDAVHPLDARIESADGSIEVVHSSAYVRDELAVIEPALQRIRLVTQPQFELAESMSGAFHPELERLDFGENETVNLAVAGQPVAVTGLRLNIDALDDLVVGVAGNPSIGPGGLVVSRTYPFATFVVNDSQDKVDADWGDGKCETEDGTCTFRAAVAEANYTDPGTPTTHDLITFSVLVVNHASAAGVAGPTTVDGGGVGSVEVIGDGISVQHIEGKSSVRGMVVKGLTIKADAIAENNYVELAEGATTFNDGYGLEVEGRFGGKPIVRRNVIGTVRISGTDVKFEDNFVGTNALGSAATGVHVQTGAAATITDGAQNISFLRNVISGIDGEGLNVYGKDVLLQGNYFGVTASGDDTLTTTRTNLRVAGDGPVIIGGTTPDKGNVISASKRFGLDAEVDTCIVQGNYIGTDLTGSRGFGNSRDGVYFLRSERIVIGGDIPGAANVISANGGDGISVNGNGPFTISGNYVGTDATGVDSLGNGQQSSTAAGIDVQSKDARTRIENNNIGFNNGHGILTQTDGMSGEILRNDIFRNTKAGIWVRGNEFRISQNAIYDNGMLGISLSTPQFPYPNDPGDGDTGNNNLQNYPELSLSAGGGVEVNFSSLAGTSFTLDFFGSPQCDETGYGEGKSYLETETVTTDGNGGYHREKSFSVSPSRKFITATATDPDGNTSEFSNCLEIEPSREDPQALILRVMQDSLGGNRTPATQTWVEVFRSDPSNPLVPVGEGRLVQTGDEAYLDVSALGLSRGTPFLVKAWAKEFNEHRGGHLDVGDSYGTVYADNIIVDQQGGLKADVISSTSDTTWTYMGHVSVAFNLTVSIEWPASDAYVSSLEQAFRMASNLLFDATNGQAYLNKIAIYDDKVHWADCDLRILARTTAWPSAGLRGIGDRSKAPLQLPAVVYGSEVKYPGSSDRPNRKHNFLSSFVDKDLNLNRVVFAQTIVHEFGHFAFSLLDEYQNSKGEMVHRFENFGIMDDAYGSEPMRSEFSAFVTPGFKDTEQYQRAGVPGWDWLFRTYVWDLSLNSNVNLRLFWPGPSQRGMTHPQYVAGPNEDLSNPDADVGALMDFSRLTSSSTNPRREVVVLGSDGKALSDQADIVLIHFDGKEVPQGGTLTSHDAKLIGMETGTARILGGLAGERIVALSTPKSGLVVEYGTMTIPAGKGVASDPLILQLERMHVNTDLTSSLEVDPQDRLFYRLATPDNTGDPPTLSFEDEAGEGIELTLESTGEGYSTLLNPLPPDHTLWLNLVDSLGTPFSVRQHLAVVEIDTTSYVAPGFGLIRLYPGPEMSAKQVVLLTSPLPHPTAGLPDSLRRVSDLIAVESLPAGSEIGMSLQLGIDGDSLLAGQADAVTVYRWDDGWVPHPTNANTELQTATVEITEPGTYCAFLDLRKAIVVAVEDSDADPPGTIEGINNYPNPFRSTTTIPIELAQPSHVTVRVYSVLGQLVTTVADGRYPIGQHGVVFNASALPPGVYLATVTVDGHRRTGVLVHL